MQLYIPELKMFVTCNAEDSVTTLRDKYLNRNKRHTPKQINKTAYNKAYKERNNDVPSHAGKSTDNATNTK